MKKAYKKNTEKGQRNENHPAAAVRRNLSPLNSFLRRERTVSSIARKNVRKTHSKTEKDQ